MGNRNKGGREDKKPKKDLKEAKALATPTTEAFSASVDVVPRKRKTRDDD